MKHLVLLFIGYSLAASNTFYNDSMLDVYQKSIDRYKSRLISRQGDLENLRTQLVDANDTMDFKKVYWLEVRISNLEEEIERIQSSIEKDQETVDVLTPIIMWYDFNMARDYALE